MKIGEVTRVKWYELEDGKTISIHTAYKQAKPSGDVIEYYDPVFFYSDNKTFPGVQASRLDISYLFMRNSTEAESVDFFNAHPELKVKKVIEI